MSHNAAIPVFWEPIPSSYQHHTLKHQELESTRQIALKFIERQLINTGFGFDATLWTKHELHGLILGVFLSCSMHEHLKISWVEILDFIMEVDKNYNDNPYHSFRHAVDVTFVLYYMLDSHDAARFINNLDIMVLLLAAICHDLAHPGLNNLYHVNAKTDLAYLFCDKSVLENYSCSLSHCFLEKHRLLRNLCDYEKKYFVQAFNICILSTDMASHFKLMEEFTKMVNRLLVRSVKASANDPIEVARNIQETAENPAADITIQVPLLPENRLILMKILLHGADISNPCRPWEVCRKWSDLVVHEFFLQGDVEKQLGLAVSPNMDRDQSSQVDISLGFGDVIVRPFFELLASFIPEIMELVLMHDHNRMKWLEINNSVIANAPPSSPRESSSLLVLDKDRPGASQFDTNQALEDSMKQLRTAMLGRRVSVAAGVIQIPDNILASIINSKSSKAAFRKISFEYVDLSTGPSSKTSSARHSAANLQTIAKSPSAAGDGRKNASKTSLSLALESSSSICSSTHAPATGPSSRRGSIVASDEDPNLHKYAVSKRRNSHASAVPPTPEAGRRRSFVSESGVTDKKAESADKLVRNIESLSSGNSHVSTASSRTEELSPTAALATGTAVSPPPNCVDKINTLIRLCKPRYYLYKIASTTTANTIQNMLFRSKLESIIIPRGLSHRESIVGSMLPHESSDGKYWTIHRSNRIYEHIIFKRRTRPTIPLFHLARMEQLNNNNIVGNEAGGDAGKIGASFQHEQQELQKRFSLHDRQPFIDSILHSVHAGEIQLIDAQNALRLNSLSLNRKPRGINNETSSIITAAANKNNSITVATLDSASTTAISSSLHHRRAYSDGLMIVPDALTPQKYNDPNNK